MFLLVLEVLSYCHQSGPDRQILYSLGSKWIYGYWFDNPRVCPAARVRKPASDHVLGVSHLVHHLDDGVCLESSSRCSSQPFARRAEIQSFDHPGANCSRNKCSCAVSRDFWTGTDTVCVCVAYFHIYSLRYACAVHVYLLGPVEPPRQKGHSTPQLTNLRLTTRGARWFFVSLGRP